MGEMDTAVTNDEPVKNTKVVGIMDSYQHESEATANNYQNNATDITRPAGSPANSKVIGNKSVEAMGRMDCDDNDSSMEAADDGKVNCQNRTPYPFRTDREVNCGGCCGSP